MKWILQGAGVLTVLLVGIVFFTFFIRHYLPSNRGNADTTAGPQRDILTPPLRFADTTHTQAPPDAEHKSENDADFLYENTTNSDIEIGGLTKTCTCTNVESLHWKPETKQDWRRCHETSALVGLIAPGGPDLLSVVAGGFLSPDLAEKQAIGDQSVPPVVVPAGDGGFPRVGIIRMHWKAKDLGPKELSAKFSTRLKDQPGQADTVLRLYTKVVNPLNLPVEAVNLGELEPNQQRVGEFFCWSTTRRDLPLKLVIKDDPCLSTKMTPLTPKELADVVTLPKDAPAGTPKPPPALSGYRVRVSLSERVEGKQLDLGPYARRVELDAGIEQETKPSVVVQAVVRGEVKIEGGDPKNRDRIEFGTFKAARDASTSVTLIGQPGLELEAPIVVPADIARVVTAKLDKLDPSAGKPQWRLTVTIVGGGLFAGLPGSTAVELSIKGGGRKLRIPVSGSPES